MSVNGTSKFDPLTTATPAEYVALLRQVREQSGLAYRAIERRAASAGDTLPPSTLATMLNRTTLPREELVVALLRATGHDEQTIDQWVRARRALTSSAELPSTEAPAAAAHNAGAPDAEAASLKPKRPVPPKVLAALIAIVVLAAGGVVLAQLLAGPDGPPSGPARIRNVHSGLCLDERPGGDSGELFQLSCASPFVPRALVPHGDGIYHVTTDHPEFGDGCMGAAHGRAEAGNPVVDDYCQFLAGTSKLELLPVTEPLSGYRMRFVESGLCAEIVGGSKLEGAGLHLLPCDAANCPVTRRTWGRFSRLTPSRRWRQPRARSGRRRDGAQVTPAGRW